MFFAIALIFGVVDFRVLEPDGQNQDLDRGDHQRHRLKLPKYGYFHCRQGSYFLIGITYEL